MKALLLALLCLPCFAQVSKVEDLSMEIAADLLLILDNRQTIRAHDAYQSGHDYWETNSLMPRHPSRGQINRYSLAVLGAKTIIGLSVGREWRYRMNVGVVMVQIYTVNHNAMIGLGYKF